MYSHRRAVTTMLAVTLAGSAQILPRTAQADAEVHAWIIPTASGDPMPKPLPMRTNTRYAHRVLSAALKDNTSSTAADGAPGAAQPVAIVQGSAGSPSGGLYRIALGIDRGRTEWPSGSAINPTLTFTNIGSSDLAYSEGGLGAVWQIARQDGHVVYDSARGKLIPHFLIRRRLAPGQSQVFTAQVILKDSGGRLLFPGTYILRGRPGIGLGTSVETKITVDPPV